MERHEKSDKEYSLLARATSHVIKHWRYYLLMAFLEGLSVGASGVTLSYTGSVLWALAAGAIVSAAEYAYAYIRYKKSRINTLQMQTA